VGIGERIELTGFNREGRSEGCPIPAAGRSGGVGSSDAERIEAPVRPGHLHFITFSCYRRLPLLRKAHAGNLFLRTLDTVGKRYAFVLVGNIFMCDREAVDVMPDHVHLLIGEPKIETPSEVLKALKQGVSREVRASEKAKAVSSRQMKLPFQHSVSCLPRFWQRRFYDFNVWSGKKTREKLEYMHRNPVTRRLVRHPRDWPWSSWSFYYEDGPCPMELDRIE